MTVDKKWMERRCPHGMEKMDEIPDEKYE